MERRGYYAVTSVRDPSKRGVPPVAGLDCLHISDGCSNSLDIAVWCSAMSRIAMPGASLNCGVRRDSMMPVGERAQSCEGPQQAMEL